MMEMHQMVDQSLVKNLAQIKTASNALENMREALLKVDQELLAARLAVLKCAVDSQKIKEEMVAIIARYEHK